jgi:hypothetical protein
MYMYEKKYMFIYTYIYIYICIGYEDPINSSLEYTHAMYDNTVKDLIVQMAAGERIEVMIATHNRNSVEQALLTMKENNMTPQSNVYFGQLLGMMMIMLTIMYTSDNY